MGSVFKSPPKPPAPPPPPPVERDVSAAASGAMDEERAGSTYLNSFLADSRKKNKLGTGPSAGPSFLGSNS
jgi:hypothetical protein